MNKGITNTILAIAIVTAILPVCTQAIPIPHGIAGTVYLSDGVTQAPLGTSFNVTDTTSGDYIAGTTGAGPDSGAYSVVVNGTDGDTVIVAAWTATHHGTTTVTLSGDMTGIDVVMNTPSGPSAMRMNVMPEYHTFTGTSNIIWGNCHWDPADTVHTGTYNWTFDDGTSATGAVSDTAGWGHARYISVTHTYTGEGVYYATLTVTADFDGSSDSDTVKINVYNASTLTAEQLEDVKVNKSIEDGLRCLYNRQYTDGKWNACGGYYIAGTGKAVLAFENHGHIPSKDINEDIYAEYVQMGLDYLFGHLSVQTLSNQSYIGNPDTNGNGIGLYWHDSGKYGDRPPYSVPIAMIGIIGSLTPDATATTGDATYVNGRTYHNITRDICDYIAWAQNEAGGGVYRGGWRYSPNCRDSDNSVSQWPALGLLEAEKRWSITAPAYELVKDELERWANNSQNADGGFSYGHSGSSKIAMTGAGLIILDYIGADTTDPRVISATSYLNNTWDVNNADPGWRIKPYGTGSFYAMYGVYKGCLETEPSPIVYLPLPDGTRDWYADFVDYLLNTQTTDGCWPAGAAHGDVNLDTMWAILILSPAVIGGPVADAGSDQYVSVHKSVTFDGSGSYHTAGLNLIEYLWDLDASDGVNWNNPDASGKIAIHSVVTEK
ncbi:MAG: hypothetical protein C4B59_02940 [Candidatus Methanogaster sp.]|uniref:Uncharacterized protein n=1 Tax=Candidatus Methanogaster sp. TaxID=3386292 RepID=A0AC61L601_9EURY|nr:MAG: hypothetical protein C4B59_02940 [ANME-2 cluster archaeon]